MLESERMVLQGQLLSVDRIAYDVASRDIPATDGLRAFVGSTIPHCRKLCIDPTTKIRCLYALLCEYTCRETDIEDVTNPQFDKAKKAMVDCFNGSFLHHL